MAPSEGEPTAVTGVIDEAVKILGVAGSITTTISLAALSLLIAFLLTNRWLQSRRAEVKAAIDKSDDHALAMLLGGTSVSLGSLSRADKYKLARADLRTRAVLRLAGHFFLLVAFLALLGFALVLALWNDREAKPAVLSEGKWTCPAKVERDLLSVTQFVQTARG